MSRVGLPSRLSNTNTINNCMKLQRCNPPLTLVQAPFNPIGLMPHFENGGRSFTMRRFEINYNAPNLFVRKSTFWVVRRNVLYITYVGILVYVMWVHTVHRYQPTRPKQTLSQSTGALAEHATTPRRRVFPFRITNEICVNVRSQSSPSPASWL